MSAGLPATLDAWRMLAARRSFEGRLPLRSMPRLCEALLEPEGDCEYALAFARGALDVAYIEIAARAQLPLQCQRSLQRFLLPVSVTQKLALVTSEDQQDALPEGYEPLLIDAEGAIRPLDLIEDELILALPVVAIDPDAAAIESRWSAAVVDEEAEPATTRENPFAVLADFKRNKQRDRS